MPVSMHACKVVQEPSRRPLHFGLCRLRRRSFFEAVVALWVFVQVAELTQLAKNHHYQIACSKCFGYNLRALRRRPFESRLIRSDPHPMPASETRARSPVHSRTLSPSRTHAQGGSLTPGSAMGPGRYTHNGAEEFNVEKPSTYVQRSIAHHKALKQGGAAAAAATSATSVAAPAATAPIAAKA